MVARRGGDGGCGGGGGSQTSSRKERIFLFGYSSGKKFLCIFVSKIQMNRFVI